MKRRGARAKSKTRYGRKHLPRLHDWAYVQQADLDANDYNAALIGRWTRGLLIRRRVLGGELAFFTTWAPAGTTVEQLAWVG